MIPIESRSVSEIDEALKKTEEDLASLRADFLAFVEEAFRAFKTQEGIQQLLIRAGEYQGKSRGRMPR